jgi:hypothetical protein
MNSSDRTRGDPLGPPADAAAALTPPLAGTEEYGTWLDRMQRARTRHAAITRNLYTWSNYKNWADQVKGSWEQEPVDPKRK